jgi:hypothetical protein
MIILEIILAIVILALAFSFIYFAIEDFPPPKKQKG